MEIERKFLVDEQRLNNFLSMQSSVRKTMIEQYYFNTKDATFRIRLQDDKAYVALKKFVEKGVNEEIETEIDLMTAIEMIEGVTNKTRIQKTRFEVYIDHLKWDIDVIVNPEIIIAEVELPKLDYKIKFPEFVNLEITGNKNYSNEALASSIELPR